MYYKNPVTRFVLRKDFFRRVKMRFNIYKRLISKEMVYDIANLFQGEKPSIIFDAGANIGFVTHQFHTLFPEADIYSFEPNPVVFTTLQKSYERDSKVHPLNLGVGDKNGKMQFNVNANTGTSSFLKATAYHRSHQARNLLEPVMVDIVSLDEYTRQNNISQINILKLDIEGYELKALEGSQRLLNSQKIDVILTEVNIVKSYEGQPLFHHLSAFLEDHDYHLFNMDNIQQESLIRQGLIADVVYLSGTMRKKMEKEFGTENCGW